MTQQTVTSNWIEQTDELTTIIVNLPQSDIMFVNFLIAEHAPAVWDAIEQGMTIDQLRGTDDEEIYEAQCETLCFQLRDYWWHQLSGVN